MDNRIKVLIGENELNQRVSDIAEQINKDYKGKQVKVICILTGAVIFMSDLVRKLDLDIEMDFMEISSYGSSTKSSGIVRIDRDLEMPITGRTVLMVEDIIDTGRTLSHVKKHMLSQNPADLKICTLLDKPERRIVDDITPEYVGFTIPDEFVVGYGLDYNQKYRHLPYVGVLPQELQ